MAKLAYARRPAKYIQRRMVVDALRRLRAFSPLEDYRYVGFGGIEFVDFELVHRELGVIRMTSIEVDTNAADRYRFNIPFADVEMRFDRASAVLPGLLDEPELRVVWLDYECRLNVEVLQDLGTALRKLQPGSVFLVSVNAQGPARAAERLEQFTVDVEPDRVPAGVTDGTLAKSGWADASHHVLRAEAQAEIARRRDGATFEQIFHFHYADDARMLTWGGLLVSPAMRETFEATKFGELPQVARPGDSAIELAPPVLTMREALHLNSQLPTEDPGNVSGPGIPFGDIQSYAELHRWYPSVPAAM